MNYTEVTQLIELHMSYAAEWATQLNELRSWMSYAAEWATQLNELRSWMNYALQRLFFSRFILIVIVEYVLFYFAYKAIEIELLWFRASSCYVFRFSAVIATECVDLFFDWFLTDDTRWCWCLRSRSWCVWLIARWFLITRMISRSRSFIIITIDISDFVIYVSQRLICELTETNEFV
jgi:hypothetical protein